MEAQSLYTWFDNKLRFYSDKSLLEKVKHLVAGSTKNNGRITFENFERKWEGFSRFGVFLPAFIEIAVVNTIPPLSSVIKTDKAYIYPKYVSMNLEPHNYDEEDGYDNEILKKLMDEVEKQQKPIVSIVIMEGFREPIIRHAIVLIVWKKGDKFMFAYYDPIKYSKPKKGTKYEYANDLIRDNLIQFHENDYNNHNIVTWDLGADFCYSKNTEYHCPQYIMNADYCFIYCVLFILIWCNFDCPLTKDGFKSVIEKSYIVPMENLIRSDTYDSLLFRVVFMVFLTKVITLYMTDVLSQNDVKLIENANEEAIESYEFNKIVLGENNNSVKYPPGKLKDIYTKMERFSDEWREITGEKLDYPKSSITGGEISKAKILSKRWKDYYKNASKFWKSNVD